MVSLKGYRFFSSKILSHFEICLTPISLVFLKFVKIDIVIHILNFPKVGLGPDFKGVAKSSKNSFKFSIHNDLELIFIDSTKREKLGREAPQFFSFNTLL